MPAKANKPDGQKHAYLVKAIQNLNKLVTGDILTVFIHIFTRRRFVSNMR